MKNQSRDKQTASKKSSETKKESSQPEYGDKSWQNPKYGLKNEGQNKNDLSKDFRKGSCGCDS